MKHVLFNLSKNKASEFLASETSYLYTLGGIKLRNSRNILNNPRNFGVNPASFGLNPANSAHISASRRNSTNPNHLIPLKHKQQH